MAMVHKVLSAQSLRLKKMDKDLNPSPPKPPPEDLPQESNETASFDAFDELRWT
jgi:hypothetical protein